MATCASRLPRWPSRSARPRATGSPTPNIVYDDEDETEPASDPETDLEDPPVGAQATASRHSAKRGPMRLGFEDERRLTVRFQIPEPGATDSETQPYIPEQDAYGARANELDGLATPNNEDGLLNERIYAPLKAAAGARAKTKPIMCFIVSWDHIENQDGSYYFDKLDRAVAQARDQGFHVYLTLSGIAQPACRPLYNPSMRACALGAKPTGISPNPDDFGDFAAAVAAHYKGKVTAYGIWNEPNNSRFLKDGQDRHNPVDVLYRKLYLAAYNRIKRRRSVGEGPAYKDARVFIGELSHLTRSARSPSGRKQPSALRFLKDVVEPSPASDAPVRTHGVAWHLYQHVDPPRSDGRGSTRRSDGRFGVVGIGRADEIHDLIDKLAKRPKVGEPRTLVTPKAKRPKLFFTEFGYFNGPHKRGVPNPTAPAPRAPAAAGSATTRARPAGRACCAGRSAAPTTSGRSGC